MTGDIANAVSDRQFAHDSGSERRRGRPTKRAAARLGHAILEIAFRQFLHSGFAATSMDAVAAEAGVSKRTLYDRFPSKTHLFEAALNHRATIDFEGLGKLGRQNQPIEDVLLDVAGWLADKILGPRNIALYRLLAAEAHRTPELARYSEENVLRPVIDTLSGIFEQAVERGDVIDLPADFLANQFLQAICGRHIRERLYGGYRATEEGVMDEYIHKAVRLFVRGTHPQAGGRTIAAD